MTPLKLLRMRLGLDQPDETGDAPLPRPPAEQIPTNSPPLFSLPEPEITAPAPIPEMGSPLQRAIEAEGGSRYEKRTPGQTLKDVLMGGLRSIAGGGGLIPGLVAGGLGQYRQADLDRRIAERYQGERERDAATQQAAQSARTSVLDRLAVAKEKRQLEEGQASTEIRKQRADTARFLAEERAKFYGAISAAKNRQLDQQNISELRKLAANISSQLYNADPDLVPESERAKLRATLDEMSNLIASKSGLESQIETPDLMKAPPVKYEKEEGGGAVLLRGGTATPITDKSGKRPRLVTPKSGRGGGGGGGGRLLKPKFGSETIEKDTGEKIGGVVPVTRKEKRDYILYPPDAKNPKGRKVYIE